MMKSKNTLVLVELVIMLLVFLFVMAVCLGIFVKADEISKASRTRDMAVVLAENAAELLEKNQGDIDKTLSEVSYGNTEPTLDISIVMAESDRYFGAADIEVRCENEIVLSMRAAWQEVGVK